MPICDSVRVELVPARPLKLHAPPLRRTDSNSPLLRRDGTALAFVSHYLPRGHTLRCASTGFWPDGRFDPVRFLDDPAPAVGKWLQSVWRAPDGSLFGWYHAEETVACARPLFLPHIGALRSTDEGRSWRLLGDLLRRPLSEADCSYANGFLAGGYGDFCVVPDRNERWFYLHYSSYVPDESRQGVSVARYPVAAADQPGQLELWRNGRWQARAEVGDASPIFGVRRGWRRRDPDAFWGPAVHYNHALGLYVMLLNRTHDGSADIVQRGVYLSFNRDIADPDGWSPPHQIIADGSWYPQAIGHGPDEGDTLCGSEPRFFMSGFSAWTLRFRRDGPQPPPLRVSRDDFAAIFGVGPW
jgi:hypothetical protein